MLWFGNQEVSDWQTTQTSPSFFVSVNRDTICYSNIVDISGLKTLKIKEVWLLTDVSQTR